MPIGRSVFIAIAIVLIIVAGVAGYFAGTSVAPTTTVTTTVTSTIAVTHTVTVTATTASPTPTPSPTASPTPTPPPGATIIEMWDGLGGGDGWVMDQLINKFNQQYGSRYFIVRTMIGWGDLFPKLVTLAKAGEIGGMPHIVLHHEYEIPLLKDMVIVPVDDVMKQLGLSRDDFLSIIVNKVTYDGKMYSIPWDQHTFALYFRTDLAKQYGIKIPPPACTTFGLQCWDKTLDTLDDFNEWLEKEVKPKLPSDVVPMAVSGFGWELYGWWPKNAVIGDGTDLKPKPEITAPYSIEVLKKLRYAVEAGLMTYQVPWADLANCLAGGKVFSWIHGNWMMATYDILPGGCPYGVAPVLKGTGGSWAASHVISITVRAAKDPKALEGVIEFFRFLYTAENNAYWGLNAGHVPAYKPAAEIYKRQGPPQKQMFYSQVFEFGIKYMPAHPLTHQINDILGQYSWQAVVTGAISVEEAAKAMQDEIETLIATYIG
ncbi:MAG: extracellular solute-binding protein [Ignisphaera sp.]